MSPEPPASSARAAVLPVAWSWARDAQALFHQADAAARGSLLCTLFSVLHPWLQDACRRTLHRHLLLADQDLLVAHLFGWSARCPVLPEREEDFALEVEARILFLTRQPASLLAFLEPQVRILGESAALGFNLLPAPRRAALSLDACGEDLGGLGAEILRLDATAWRSFVAESWRLLGLRREELTEAGRELLAALARHRFGLGQEAP